MSTRLEAVKNIAAKRGAPPLRTPSQYPFPVFALCPPVYVDNAIQNNPTMKEKEQQAPIDREKFLAQWYNLYNVVAANSLVYLITPVRGLQDQTYVNCFAYLPHIQDRDVIVLSNFTGEGRAGEEIVAGKLFKDLGYTVDPCPFKFEGEPELKYLRGNTYLGGYGFRSDIRAHHWLQRQYGAHVIPIKETDPVLYHLDCSAFPIGEFNVLLCAEIMDADTVHEIERVTNVIPVTKQDCYAGIANSLLCDDVVYNASPIHVLKHNDPHYGEEKRKNETLERICRDLGKELIFFDMSECEKSGAKLSCFFGHMNYH